MLLKSLRLKSESLISKTKQKKAKHTAIKQAKKKTKSTHHEAKSKTRNYKSKLDTSKFHSQENQKTRPSEPKLTRLTSEQRLLYATSTKISTLIHYKPINTR